ncbi:Txe/YoeB family addiction module toxin [Desulfobacterales bacterium HSG16]|nr:Txe/YoeB family addiction module toxin [Desulfobacterales bacterium HSG16]
MRMLLWMPVALNDLEYWRKKDSKKLKRIVELCVDTCKHPQEGKGKPEPLKFNLTECWSRRINKEHRLVYRFDDDTVHIIQARYHYE